MNLKMIQPKIETQHLLLSITEKCETLIKQTYTKAEETLEFKLTKQRKTFHFKPPIEFQGSWMIGLTNLEVYHSIFNITEENNKVELYTQFLDSEISYTKLKDDVAEVLGLSDISIEDLEHKKYGPNIIKTDRKLSKEKSQTDGFLTKKINFIHSSFRDFESYLRISSPLGENDIQLILKQNSSKFITYKFSPGVHTFKDLAEVLSRGFKVEFEIRGRIRSNGKYDGFGSIIIESDNVTLITTLNVNPQLQALRFDKKLFFNTIVSFSPYWDFKRYDNEYYSEKNRNLGTIDKI